uniref:Uncharacterized protein n=1 Tax=Arundo donax TaxID=35708 RepID=A0A0A8YNS7_ARUDO
MRTSRACPCTSKLPGAATAAPATGNCACLCRSFKRLCSSAWTYVRVVRRWACHQSLDRYFATSSQPHFTPVRR